MFDGTGILLLALFIVCVISVIYLGWWAITEAEEVPGFLAVLCCVFGVFAGWSLFLIHPTHHRDHIQAVADLTAEHLRFDHLSVQDHSVNVWAGKCRFDSVALVRDPKTKRYWPAIDVAAYQVPPKKVNTSGEVGAGFWKQVARLSECQVVQR